jgi:predicted deacylase
LTAERYRPAAMEIRQKEDGDMGAIRRKETNRSTNVRYSFLKILTGSDLSRRRLPFMAAESSRPGPVLWVTACGHGDEVGGAVIIQEIFKRIRRSGLSRGSLYSFPLMNPIGFETSSRNITLTKEDLNRSFPGNVSGSLGERIADKIFTSIMQTNPALVVDLHNDWIRSIPYTVIDPESDIQREQVCEKARSFAGKTGLLIVRETDGLEGALTYNLLKNDVPALTLELGESFVVNEKNIQYGIESLGNILSDLEMMEPGDEPFAYPLPEAYEGRILAYSDRPLCSTSGIIRFRAKPGDLVKARQPIAKIYNAFGRLQETVLALSDGIVLGHSDSSVAFPGMPVMAFGVPREHLRTQDDAKRVGGERRTAERHIGGAKRGRPRTG